VLYICIPSNKFDLKQTIRVLHNSLQRRGVNYGRKKYLIVSDAEKESFIRMTRLVGFEDGEEILCPALVLLAVVVQSLDARDGRFPRFRKKIRH